jgi:Tachylectin
MAFTSVTSDGGVIYAVANSGALLWYQDIKRDGTNGSHAESGWASNSGSQIGSGWNEFKYILSGGAGIIYAIKATGELLWYRDVARRQLRLGSKLGDANRFRMG